MKSLMNRLMKELMGILVAAINIGASDDC